MSENESKKMSKLVIEEGNEHHANPMDIYDESAFFYRSYKQAAQAITEIANHSIKFNKKDNCNEGVHKNVNAFELSEYYNNIVAFCADRGQGKTSAMLSVAQALKEIPENNNRKITEFWNDKDVYIPRKDEINPVLNMKFEILNPIDPTRMEKSDSIVKNVISKMFKSASDKWGQMLKRQLTQDFDENYYQKCKSKLTEKFLACFRALDYLYKEESDLSTSYDDLNMLAEYGDSSNFKQSFIKLIEEYLEFMSMCEQQKSSMLVILIDDADLNTQNAYSITEEIRKYCIIPNVIVCMALHIGTLSRTIEQHFLLQYKTIISMGKDELVREKCHKIMERYIDKLIPSSHQIFISSIYNFLRDDYDKIGLSYIDNDRKEKLVSCNEIINSPKGVDGFQEKLIELVYRKTGIVLAKPDYYLHDFLPSNLRELNHFLYYMSNMNDVIRVENEKVIGTIEYILDLCKEYSNGFDEKVRETIVSEINNQLDNLEHFSNYFVNTWCAIHLDSVQFKIIETLQRSSRAFKNLRTIELIKDYAQKKIKNREQKGLPKEYVPFSDVINSLYELKNTDNPQSHFDLIYSIYMYYTIYLHKLALNGIKRWISDKESMEEASPFKDLCELLGFRIFPFTYYKKKGINKNIFSFFNKSALNTREQYRVFRHFLCGCKIQKPKRRRSAFSEKYVTYNYYFNSNVVTMDFDGKYSFTAPQQYFDYFRPLVSVLYEKDFFSQFISPQSNLPVSIPGSMLNIVLNIDLQNLIYERFFKERRGSYFTFQDRETIADEKMKEIISFDIVEGIYRDLDTIINDNLTLKINVSFNAFKDIFDPSGFICFTRENGESLISLNSSSDNIETNVYPAQEVVDPTEEKETTTVDTATKEDTGEKLFLDNNLSDNNKTEN